MRFVTSHGKSIYGYNGKQKAGQQRGPTRMTFIVLQIDAEADDSVVPAGLIPSKR